MVENILNAINLADLDGLKSVEVDVKDLKVLRDEIKLYRAVAEELKKQKAILSSKLSLSVLDRPFKLNLYV